MQLAASPIGPARVDGLRRMLSIDKRALQVQTLDDAYDRYHARGLDTPTLAGYGGLLEKLVRGQLLSPQHTQPLYTDQKHDTCDAYRLEAGLPTTVRFIHKTGTQSAAPATWA